MGVGKLGLGALAAVGGVKAGKRAWDTLRQVGNGHGAQHISELPDCVHLAPGERLMTARASLRAGFTVRSPTASIDRRTS